jgi:hypothetical protein
MGTKSSQAKFLTWASQLGSAAFLTVLSEPGSDEQRASLLWAVPNAIWQPIIKLAHRELF